MGINPPCHARDENTTDTWITPRWLIGILGPFDLDPCAADRQPWPCAAKSFTVADDGLMQRWDGFVFCNPPYGAKCKLWLRRMSAHNHGIALVFTRTETRMWFEDVWDRASAVLFMQGRLTFHREDGSKAPKGHNSGGPSALIGYGELARERLRAVRLGKFLELDHGRQNWD